MLQSQSMASIVAGIGYIGSRLVQELLALGQEVVGLENFFATDRRAVEQLRQSMRFRLVEGSITDSAAVARTFDEAETVEGIFLLAAQASGHPNAAAPEYTEEANLRGPRIVLDEAVRRRVSCPIVFASSMLVYGTPLPDVVDESTPYGRFADLSHLSKCYVEKLLEMYAAIHQLDCRVVRLGLTYGIAPVMKTDPRFMTAPNLFCYRAARHEPIEVRSRHALATIHVDDAVHALLQAAGWNRSSGFSIANAVGAVTTIPEIAEHVRELGVQRGLTVRIVGPGTIERLSAMPVVHSRLERDGFRPRRSLIDGLSETLDYFLKHHGC
ncbi:MAG TPA: NAD(P)-dependent oxidoreductase [Chloroflexota bacterium]|nr:NAD(P)-dependent oxidoreductase [Chloroflexota bacterium]